MHPGSLAQVQLVDDQVSEESKVRDTAESEVLPSADELIPLTELQSKPLALYQFAHLS